MPHQTHGPREPTSAGGHSRVSAQVSLPGIAVVVAVHNGAGEVRQLLTALAEQTRAPDDVIIVNDGSTDATGEVLEACQDSPLTYRVVDTDQVGIGSARNLGIAHTSCEWIACTDVGCLPVSGWLEAIEDRSPRADFVAGVVILDARSTLERVLALSVFPRPDEIDEPSVLVRLSHRLFGREFSESRTGGGYMAFRRTAWSAVGGFPSGLGASEDRAFSTRVADAGFRLVREPRAAVHWRPRGTLRQNLMMFFEYARGDVRFPPRRRHLIRGSAYATTLLTLRHGRRTFRAALIFGASAYLWLPIRRAARDQLPLWNWALIPGVIGLKDVAQLLGAAAGVVDAAFARGDGNGERRISLESPSQPQDLQSAQTQVNERR